MKMRLQKAFPAKGTGEPALEKKPNTEHMKVYLTDVTQNITDQLKPQTWLGFQKRRFWLKLRLNVFCTDCSLAGHAPPPPLHKVPLKRCIPGAQYREHSRPHASCASEMRDKNHLSSDDSLLPYLPSAECLTSFSLSPPPRSPCTAGLPHWDDRPKTWEPVDSQSPHPL